MPLELDVSSLLSDAIAHADGLSEWGPGPVELPLKLLVDDLEHHAALTPSGWQRFWEARLGLFLQSRLRTQAALASRPHVDAIAIPRPLFVVSFPRSGSTLLQNLLAQDPLARWFKLWELMHPYPWEGEGEGGSDPRVAATERAVRIFNPAYHKIHPVGVHRPDECHFLFNQSLTTWDFPILVKCPSYREWLIQADSVEAYRVYRRALKLLLEQRPCPPKGHVLLKDPVNHIGHLDTLQELFPDACMLVVHRNVVEMIGSTCSMIRSLRGLFAERVDPTEIGEEVLRWAELSLGRADAALRNTTSSLVIEVRYRDLVRDPVQSIRAVYDTVGLTFSEELEQGITRWLRANPKDAKGVHAYRLEDFGLTAPIVEKRLAFWTARASRIA